MVIAPSPKRFADLLEYSQRRAAELEAAEADDLKHNVPLNVSRAEALGKRLVGSAEQSFIREFHEDILHSSITEMHEARRGWDWSVRSYTSSRPCDRLRTRAGHSKDETCTAGTVHVMSRRYNARPHDCGKCPMDSYEPLIVHYACSRKPWQTSRESWLTLSWCHGRTDGPVCWPCQANYTRMWYNAEDRMCKALAHKAPLILPEFAACKSVIRRS